MGGVSNLFRDRVLILGLTPLAERLIREIKTRPSRRCVVVGVVDDKPSLHPGAYPIVGPFRRLAEIVRDLRPHRIVVALVERRGRTPVRVLLDSCVPRGVIVEEGAEFYERVTGKMAIEALPPTSIVFSRRFRPSRFQQGVARGLSLLVAMAALAALSPFMALIALAIKLDSRGPLLSAHERAGARRRPFKLLKFRTTHASGARQRAGAGDDDTRVTRVGKWLHAWRLDGLPQFINVIRGEMNLVGPRAHPLSDLELFTLVARNQNELTGIAIGYYELRFMVRPGLTGWAQVRSGCASSLDEEIEKLRFDLYYIKHASPWLDLRILLETLKALVSPRRSGGAARTAAHPAPGPRRRIGFPDPAGRPTASSPVRSRQPGLREASGDAIVNTMVDFDG